MERMFNHSPSGKTGSTVAACVVGGGVIVVAFAACVMGTCIFLRTIKDVGATVTEDLARSKIRACQAEVASWSQTNRNAPMPDCVHYGFRPKSNDFRPNGAH
jgi:hypothetical protein